MSRIIPRFSVPHGCLFLLLWSAPFAARQTSDQQKPAELPPPVPGNSSSLAATFKSRSDLVLLPVVVRDHKGNHTAGLTKDAFRLEEKGKEQEISLFEEIKAPDPDAKPSLMPDRGYSNLPFDNASQLRLTIVVLDLLNTRTLQRTDGKDLLVKFLSKGFPPNQPVSLLALTSKGLKLIHPFSTDTNALVEALQKTPVGAETIVSRINVVTSTIRQLQDIAQAYTGVPGRKSMIFATGYLPELKTEREIIDTSIYAGDLHRMWKSLVDANVSVYPIQLLSSSVNPTPGDRPGRAIELLLRNFADATGGDRCIEANDGLRCLAAAVEDSRSYYMLGFTVQPNDRKPGWRDLKVKVSAEHADVRTRDGFYFGQSLREDPKSAHDDEVSALASPLAYSAVPMFVKALPSPAPSSPAPAADGKKTVEFLVTIPLGSVGIDPLRPHPLDLEVGAIALTSDNREAAEFIHPVQGNPKPENLEAWARDGIKFQEKLDLPAGSYNIRFLARDNNTSLIGTVVFPLDVK